MYKQVYQKNVCLRFCSEIQAQLRAAFAKCGITGKDQDELVKLSIQFDNREAIDDRDAVSGEIADSCFSLSEFWLMCGPIVLLRQCLKKPK